MELRKLLPDAPQMGIKQLEEWMRNNGGHSREVLRYRKRSWRNPLSGELEYYAETECTICHQKMETLIIDIGSGYPKFENYTGIVSNGEMTNCPYCGARVEAAYYGRLSRHPIKSTRYPWEIVKKDGNIFFICWAVIYEVGRDYQTIEVEKRNAYVLDTEGKWHRFTAMGRSGWSAMSKMEYIGTWYEKSKFDIADGNIGYMLPHSPDVFEGTLLENAKIEKLEALQMGANVLNYARIYMRHKTAENITMQSPHLMAAATWWSGGVTGLDWIDWKAAKPHEMLRITKPEYKELCSKTGQEAKDEISRLYAASACSLWGAPKEYAKTLGLTGAAFAFSNKNNKMLRQFGLVSIWNYIKKQARGGSLDGAVELCKDYWRDLPKIGADTTSREVMFPSNLREAHARVIMAIKYEEDEALRKKFAKVTEKLSPLKWENEGLMITPAESESQLIAEGKILQHCVGGYGKSHCEGNSIFFIRHTSEAQQPFFTLQLDTKTGRVLQNRGLKNCSRTKEVEAFEEAWITTVVLPWVKQNSKKERKTA